MQYPTIPASKVLSVAARLLDGDNSTVEESVVHTGSGEALDLGPIVSIAAQMRAELESHLKAEGIDGDAFEGSIAGRLHSTMVDISITILDDPGFWRYLALTDFWWLVRWREPHAFDSEDPARYGRYIDGKRSAECIPLRVFLRGQISFLNGDYELASAVPAGTDFWRSHIIRVSTWTIPRLAQRFIRMQATERLPTEPLRRVARQLNRRRASVALHEYDQEEIDALLEELREEA